MLKTVAALVMASLTLAACSQPTARTARLVEVASFGHRQPVGITVSSEDRMFVSFPRQTGAEEFRFALAEVVNGKEVPFPDIAWNVYDPQEPDRHFMNLQAVIAQGDTLWALDAAQVLGEVALASMKLVSIDLRSGKVKRVYRFEDIPSGSAALNDVRIDHRRNLAYFSDPKRSALVVLDLQSGKTRTLLAGSRPTRADPHYVLKLDGRNVVGHGGKPFANNVNGIALTDDGEWFYFRAITQESLYRIQTRYLADASLTDVQLLEHVQDLGKVGVSHGMLSDPEGNIYLTDSVNYAINRRAPGGALEQWVTDPRLSWPDTLALGPDGILYVTAAQINRTTIFSDPSRVDFPFRVYRVAP